MRHTFPLPSAMPCVVFIQVLLHLSSCSISPCKRSSAFCISARLSSAAFTLSSRDVLAARAFLSASLLSPSCDPSTFGRASPLVDPSKICSVAAVLARFLRNLARHFCASDTRRMAFRFLRPISSSCFCRRTHMNLCKKCVIISYFCVG